MPSPFPGMNPYLEVRGSWEDFHSAFIQRLRAQLAARVRPRYFVRVERQVYLREWPDLPWALVGKPDLSVTGPRPAVPGTATATLAAPVTVQLGTPAVEEYVVRRLEVVLRDREEVVTVLELLRPANKDIGADREQYLRKRLRLLDAGVNVVELDLLRGGPRTVPGLPACDYCALVARSADRPAAAAWPFRLADPFPPVPVPLRPGEPEPVLDMKLALDTVYDEAVYEDSIYRGIPDPALTADQAAWAAGFVPPPAG